MDRHSRKRRAAISDIYPVCVRWGNCPADVQNKVEQTTVADKILKIGSTGVFLGSLGISSSVPTVGTVAADAILGQAVKMGPRVGLLNPDIPLASVGPRDVLPVDVPNPLGPARSSLVPAEEIPLHTLSVHEISPQTVETFLEDTSLSILPGETSGPKVQLSQGHSSILEVPPAPPIGRGIVFRSQYDNPAFEVSVHTNIDSAETSASDQVLIHSHTGGHVIGEEIPLRTIGPYRPEPPLYDEDIMNDTVVDFDPHGQRTSTPVKPTTGRGSRAPRRRGILSRLFNRRTTQIPISEPEFVTNPSRMVTFENPAFEPSTSLIFEQDLETAAAPHPEFRDIVRLGRQVLTEGPSGRVQISRLGKKGTIKTRSGVQIGSDVHYYKEISSIHPEQIELRVLGEQSGEAAVADGLAESGIHTELLTEPPAEGDLFIPEQDVSQSIQVHFGGVTDNNGVPVVDYIGTPKSSLYIVDTDEGVVIDYPESQTLEPSIVPTDIPLVLLDVFGYSSGNYYLHPSLLKKKKKKVHF